MNLNRRNFILKSAAGAAGAFIAKTGTAQNSYSNNEYGNLLFGSSNDSTVLDEVRKNI
jgi:hypothetical protein